MEFKVGDKVKLIDAKGLNVHGATFTAGKVYTVIRGNQGCDTIRLNGDNGNEFGLYTRRFELAYNENGVDAEGNPLMFAVADLKPLQRVVLKNGMCGIITTGTNGIVGMRFGRNGGRETAYFETTESYRKGFVIVEVYDAPADYGDGLDADAKGKLLWKKADPVKARKMKEADAAVAEAEAALNAARAARAAL